MEFDWSKVLSPKGKKKRGKKKKGGLIKAMPTKPVPTMPTKAISSINTRFVRPKGVPRSFLEKANYQFQSINMTWLNPMFHAPAQTSQSDATEQGEQPQDDTQGDKQDVMQDNSHALYSPSDMYKEIMGNESDESSEVELNDDDILDKQTNVYDRLGPPKPKQPKLTINLKLNNPKTDRTVVVENITDSKYIPVPEREEVKNSTDPIVKKYLTSWPWRNDVTETKIVGRDYKLLSRREQSEIQGLYNKNDTFVKVSVKGYPGSWDMQDVLDAVIEGVRGQPFMPCCIEFSITECNFLVLECRLALIALHNYGYNIRKDNVDLEVTVSFTNITLKKLKFMPKSVLKQIVERGYDKEKKLSLKAFTLKEDISHFIYFPLHRIFYQSQLIDLADNIAWDYIVELDLSHNRLVSIAGFDLAKTTPRLRNLDLSHNLFERLLALACCRNLELKSICLEGNPVCRDYTDPTLYVDVIRTLFPCIDCIDGVQISRKGEMPKLKRNFCPEDAGSIVNVILEVYFPLLEASRDQKSVIEHLYYEDAVLTVTCRQKLRFSHFNRSFQELLLRVRSIEDDKYDAIEGSAAIAKIITKWPEIQFDHTTFTVDVMYHSDAVTVIKVGGLLKLVAATLAEDEHFLAFTITFVLKTINGVEYKIINQMIYWDEPTREYADSGFKLAKTRKKKLSFKFDNTPDEELKEKLIELFMKLTKMDRTTSERCLTSKEWHFKNAVEHFVDLLKPDQLDA